MTVMADFERQSLSFFTFDEGMLFSADGPVDTVTGTVDADIERRSLSPLFPFGKG